MSILRPKIAVSLGGGGARGLAHLGVLKVLEKNKIPIDIITASSMGAIVGAAYALKPDAYALEKNILSLLKNKALKKIEAITNEEQQEKRLITLKKLATLVKGVYLWNLSAIKGYLITEDDIKYFLEQLVDEKRFDQTKLKFACIATDLDRGEEVILDKGRLDEAVYASSAIPGVFPPKRIDKRLLIDGGIINLTPVECARSLGADLVIAVNVDKDIKPRNFKYGYDIMLRADAIRRHELNLLKLKKADIIIEPEVGSISWTHFSKGKEIIKKGEIATQNIIPKIKRLTRRRNLKSLIRNLFGLVIKK